MNTALKRKISTLRKMLKNGITKPCKMGDKILLLATAPCANYYFENESVRKQFEEYDLAIINFMLLHSENEVFKLQPKYIILFDPIFYTEGLKGDIIDFDAKKAIKEILERVNWECYVVTTVFADFEVKNDNIKYIRLNFLFKGYHDFLYPLFRRNWINMGFHNVIQGALFFAITFGYKTIAMLGCPYKHLKFHMETDGMHIEEHMHYYDKEPYMVFIPNDELEQKNPCFTMNLYKRAYESSKILWGIKRYALREKAQIINYSEDSEIDVFSVGKLNLENSGR